ncbi:MAG: hypothetical protein H7301_03020 [Cryobacterium sp.]|nr:hypothetical protein [Oligoflexia bacterium]
MHLKHTVEGVSFFAKIPVLVATAKGSPKEELKGLPAHIGRIRKPMEIEEFLNSVLEKCGKPSP